MKNIYILGEETEEFSPLLVLNKPIRW